MRHLIVIIRNHGTSADSSALSAQQVAELNVSEGRQRREDSHGGATVFRPLQAGRAMLCIADSRHVDSHPSSHQVNACLCGCVIHASDVRSDG